MSNRAGIAILLLVLIFAFVVYSIFSTYLSRGQSLAQDFIAAGFRPGEPFRPNSGDVTRSRSDYQLGLDVQWHWNYDLVPKSDTNSTFYRNARIVTDSGGLIVSMDVEHNADEPYFKEHYPTHYDSYLCTYKPDDSNLSAFCVRTRKGRDILSLTRLEIRNLYGYPNYPGFSEIYRYRINSKEGVDINVYFDGIYPDSMVTEVSAQYYSDPHLWYGETTDYFTWPKR